MIRAIQCKKVLLWLINHKSFDLLIKAKTMKRYHDFDFVSTSSTLPLFSLVKFIVRYIHTAMKAVLFRSPNTFANDLKSVDRWTAMKSVWLRVSFNSILSCVCASSHWMHMWCVIQKNANSYSVRFDCGECNIRRSLFTIGSEWSMPSGTVGCWGNLSILWGLSSRFKRISWPWTASRKMWFSKSPGNYLLPGAAATKTIACTTTCESDQCKK